MTISPVLLVGVLSIGVSSLEAVQDPARDLRNALGGDAAMKQIARLHIKANFVGGQRGKGESNTYFVLPDGFIEKSHGVYRYTSPAEQYPRLTAGADGISLVEQDTESEVGFAGGEPIFIDGRMGPKDKARDGSLRAARFAFGRWMIPLFGGGWTMSSVFAESGALEFQDRDATAWHLTLDAAGRPATLTWERAPFAETRYTKSATMVTTFSDYRPVSGLIWPHRIVTSRDGKPWETIEIKQYEINGKTPKEFIK